MCNLDKPEYSVGHCHTIQLITSKKLMCVVAGAYKVVGAKQCSSMRKEVSMATLLVVPTKTFSSFGASKATTRVKWDL